MGPPGEEEQLGPPEEEQLGPPEAVQVEEPTAPVQEPTASATTAPAEAPAVAAVLPVLESPSATPKRHRGVELTAQTPTPLLAEVLQPPPKLRRLQQKTSVPQHVCPRTTTPSTAWEKEVL